MYALRLALVLSLPLWPVVGWLARGQSRRRITRAHMQCDLYVGVKETLHRYGFRHGPLGCPLCGIGSASVRQGSTGDTGHATIRERSDSSEERGTPTVHVPIRPTPTKLRRDFSSRWRNEWREPLAFRRGDAGRGKTRSGNG